MSKYRWPMLTAGAAIVVLLVLFMFAAPVTRGQGSSTPTPTSLLDSLPQLVGPTPSEGLALTPSPTRERTGLASPTPEATKKISAPLMTLTAFSGMVKSTFEARPTWTPGPSAILLDGKPQFVKFYADWCGPCREMKPFVESMKEKYKDQVTFWDINTDAVSSRGLSVQYNVQFIPLVVLLDPKGNSVARLEGLQSEDELDAAIQNLLKVSQGGQ